MNYAEWLKTVPETLTEDSVWKMEAYRLAMFAADVAWVDVTKLFQDKRTLHEQAVTESIPTDILTNVSLP